jgi:amino acid adenylation domain-containing protein
MTDLAEQLAHLSPDQREAVLRRLREGGAARPAANAPDAPTIPRTPRDGPLPLSFAQRRLWLQTRLAPDSPFYTIHAAFRLRGPRDEAALQGALDTLVARHESLRTRFGERDGTAWQEVVPSAEAQVALQRVELSGLSPEAAEREALRLSEQAGRRPFDLTHELPIRAVLLTLGAEEAILLLTVHHIVADGWSLSVLLREFGVAYAAARSGTPPALPELPVQYADFAAWQARQVSGARLERQLAYWTERLADAPDVLELPTDRPRPSFPSYSGGIARFTLEPALSARLKALSAEAGGTLFAALQAAWLAVLARYTGQSDLLVGAPLANRTVPEVEGLIGFFVNTVALRCDLSDEPSFRDLIGRVHAASLEAQDHQDVPFEQVVEAVRPERSASHHPLVQTVLAYQTASRETLTLEGLEVSQLESHVGATRFDLEMHLWDRDGGQAGFLFYAADLFDAETAERLVGHFQTFLERAAETPDAPLGEIDILSAAERTRLLDEWGANPRPYPRDASVPAVFAEQVAARPDAVALEQGETALTYGELAARARRLAGLLAAEGDRAPVALCLERSPAAVVAMLASLLAGRAYVPLDPAWPHERLRQAATDSGATLLLGGLEGAPNLGLPNLCLNPSGRCEDSSEESPEKLPAPAATDMAYVMYTSGSTGRPKGVAVPHRAILRLACCADFVRLGPDSAMLHMAPATFDAATLEIWGPLLTGGRLVLAPPGRVSLSDLAELVRRHGVTAAWLTAGLFHLVVDEAPEVLANLREVLAGGDVLSPERVARALEIVGGGRGRVVNGYGPTENTTFTCCHVMAPGQAPATGGVPIGRPVPNTTVRLVDARGRLVPQGVPGELWTGGDGLALGYLDAPELTAERFVADPLEPGARLYRTGDLARWRPDGTLEFLGRRDTQVKVRGFRVELEEIERSLRAQPGVQDALVAVSGEAAEAKSLVAFVVPAAEEADDAEARASFVSTWRELYEQTYGAGTAARDPGALDFTGWNSSYTGAPIDEAEMREWRAATLAQLHALGRSALLEVGCGTGLLLSDLAPRAARYRATDYSQAALDRVAALRAARGGLEHLELARGEADDWRGIAPGSFETVILNSVCQYFPDEGYLRRVVEGALSALAPGGHLFLGDLRSLPLLEAFHASLAFAKGEGGQSVTAWRAAVRQACGQEEELLLDPAWIAALDERPEVAAVEIRPKRGAARNELTAFRYDAVVRRAGAPVEPLPVAWVDWADLGSAEAMAARLAEADGPLGVTGVPNARLAEERVLLSWLEGEAPGETLADLRAALPDSTAAVPGLEDLALVGERAGRALVASWPHAGAAEGFDLVFLAPGAEAPEVGAIAWPRQAEAEGRVLTNTPVSDLARRKLAESLRTRLEASLPAFMLPERIVAVAAIPLTENGKPDRKALLEGLARGTRSGGAPRPGTETEVAAVWAEVLQVEGIGREDDFFALGGHSLLATQIVARLQARLGLELPLAEFFAAPSVAGLAARLDAGRASGTPGAARLPQLVPDPAEANAPFPLTDIQQAYWLGRGSAFEHGGVASHVYLEMDAADLDLDAAEAAWNRLVRRHPMLRAVIEPDGRQRVLPEVPDYGFAVAELTEVAPEVGAAALAEIRDALSHRAVSGSEWPLFEIRAARLPGDRVRIFFSIDALIADAWSLSLLFEEWRRLTAAPNAELPATSVTFRDYVLAEARLRDGPAYARARDYWQARAPELPPAPQLPRAAAPAGETPRFTGWSGRLEPEAWARFKRRARARGVTPSVALMAAFADVLATWSASPRFTLNLTLFQRLPLHPEVERIVGDFTSLNLLEVDAASSRRFGERAKAMQARLWQDLDHRSFGGIEVLRELARHRGDAPAALMPVVFTSALPLGEGMNASQRLVPFGELAYSVTQTPQVWLDAGVREEEGALLFGWNAVAEIFPAGLLDAMFGAYGDLLERLASDEAAWSGASGPLVPAGDLAVQAAANATAGPLPTETLHGLALSQARRTPDAPAVLDGERTVTYGELAAMTGRLAAALQAAGVRPGEPVAVCLERGWAQAAAVLGILAAGAAYVPVDPALPAARRAHLMTHSGCRLALSDARLIEDLDWPEGVRPLDLPAIAEDAEAPSVAPAAPDPDALAYVIYTSGSTGQPKGVAVSHRAALNTILDVNRRWGMGPDDRTLCLSALTFDLSVHDLFGTLAAGGALVAVPPAGAREPRVWAELLERHRVSLWNTVPALMELLVDQLEQSGGPAPGNLRLVLLSGDWIPLSLPDRVRALWPEARVVSLGGATEGAIWSIFHEIDRVDPGWTSIPYGKPLTNQSFHVLDGDFRPRPVWVPGELHIGGAGVALGYWNDPERTAASFVTDPHTGQRLYRTGDLGRYLPDGSIEFLGRQDFQVKINGHRVELGEIEAALEAHPGVARAAVTAAPLKAENGIPKQGPAKQGPAKQGPGAGPRRLVGHVALAEAAPGAPLERLSAEPAQTQAWWDAALAAGRAASGNLPADELEGISALRAAMEELATAAMQRSLRRLGVFTTAGETHTAAGLVAAAGLPQTQAKLLGQWLAVLAEDGLLRKDGSGAAASYTAPQPLPEPDLAPLAEKVEAAMAPWPETRPALAYFLRALDAHEALLRGTADPLELLFPEGRTDSALAIYQLNPLAHYQNDIAAQALAAGVRARLEAGAESVRILEVGAGTGATTAHLLPALAALPEALAEGRLSYVFTDLSSFFLDQAEDRFADTPYLETAILDIDADPTHQGFHPAQTDILVASNVLHNLHHAVQGLTRLKRLLAPGGQTLVLEGTVNSRLNMTTVAFLEGFGNYADERLETNLPLLSAAGWERAMAGAGLMATASLPDDDRAGLQVVLGRAADTASRFDAERLRAHLADRLPEHMVPPVLLSWQALPLTTNGKLDRAALEAAAQAAGGASARTAGSLAPRSAAEAQVHAAWAKVLGHGEFGVEDAFFAIGGDSLLAMQAAAAIGETTGVTVSVREMLESGTVAALARLVEAAAQDQDVEEDIAEEDEEDMEEGVL